MGFVTKSYSSNDCNINLFLKGKKAFIKSIIKRIANKKSQTLK